jgi:phosphoglucosamine mutase
MGRLFGTDGVRGVANVDLTPPLAYELGRAAGHVLDGSGRSVVIGQDTRRSGDMLVAALGAGLAAVGADVVELGVVTTPGLAFVAADPRYAAGIMVSASHNPAEDNGIKVLTAGRKLDDELELELERLIATPNEIPLRRNGEIGRITRDASPMRAYREHLREAAGEAFTGLRLAIDCAHGSACSIAPALFSELGADVTVLFDEPDGTNINHLCGSTHPETLAAAVVERGCAIGLAFDGDADRLIAVDERGAVVDGDAIMGILALDRLAAGTLRNNLLVVTVLSNGGLDRAVQDAGGRVLRTPVGDRHVLEAMEKADATLGGEQSGHIIFRERATTGDGLLTAIELVKSMRREGVAPLSELAARVPMLPQVMINSAVRHKDTWESVPEFRAAVERETERLGKRGRILVRPSGTEPRIRIMVEGDDPDEIAAIARRLDELAQARLN